MNPTTAKNIAMKQTQTLVAALVASVFVICPSESSAQSGRTTSFSYDAVGQVTSVTAPSGRLTQLQWDAFGRNVLQSRAGAGVGMAYNFQDALSAMQDPRGLTTSYDRNGFGEARSQASPDTGNSNFTYDGNGNLTSRVNAASQVESYVYDAADRVVSKSLSHPSSGSITYSFAYGTSGAEAGQLVQVAAPGMTLSYSHNLYGQVTSATQALSGTAAFTVGYGYANNGARTSVTYPSGRVVTYTLDSASRISGITVDGNPVLSGVSYTALGAVAGWTFGSGAGVTRAHDASARLTSVTMPWGSRQYVYDVDDRIVGINDSLLGNATYGYDDVDRLTSASNAFGSWTYQYDANGNRTSASVNGSSYGTSVDAASNRLLAAGQRQNTFTADGQTAQVAGAGSAVGCGLALTMGYQADGQLVTSNVLSAVHAPNGLRLQKTAAACAGGAKTNFVYDTAGHLIADYDATGAVIQETLWLGDLPVAVFRPGSGSGAFYVYADNLGTPRGATTTDGLLVWSWDGEPFGATPAIGGQLGQQGAFQYGLRFPGQYLDEETGYHHNGWREYDPAVGRYVQSDPIGLAGGLNTYVYVLNQPLSYADANGLCPCGSLNKLLDGMKADDRDWSQASSQRFVHPRFGAGSNKCNLFVDVQYESAGYHLPNVGGKPISQMFGLLPPGAMSLADSSYVLPGWPVVQGPAQPGDLIAFGGHMGIVSGDKKTTHASSKRGKVETDWGFTDDERGAVIRRCTCPN